MDFIQPALLPSTADMDNLAPNLYWDSFPPEVLDNLLRFFSPIPKAKEWVKHLDLRDLTKLLAVRGQLASFLKSRFDTLCVSKTSDCRKENKYYGWKLRTEPHLWTDSIDIAREFVVAGGGESLQTLVLGADMLFGELDVDELLKYCPNVISFSTGDYYLNVENLSQRFWIKKRGEQLEKLQLFAALPSDFEMCSTSLRELTVSRLTRGVSTTLKEFWGEMGRNLETLVVYRTRFSKNEVDGIKKYCRKLKKVTLKGDDSEARAAITSLLVSLGHQLEHTCLTSMNEYQVKDVAEACYNARFHLEFEYISESEVLDALNIVGPKLQTLNFKKDWEPFLYNDEWVTAWNNCLNLQELMINEVNSKSIEPVFASPKEQLKSLSLDFDRTIDEDEAKKVMDICASGTKGVERLTFIGNVMYIDCLNKFFKANRASLSSIYVCMDFYVEGTKLNGLYESLLELPALEEVYLSCKIPDNFSKALRSRGVYWKGWHSF